MTNPTASELRNQLIPLAKQITRYYYPFSRMDFSPKSIQLVEKVLGKLHKEYIRTGSMEGVLGCALEFAAYIVEVIDQNFGPVDWQRDDPQFGQDVFPLYWREQTLFPFIWCQKRIIEGEEDNVWHKFSILVLNKVNPRK